MGLIYKNIIKPLLFTQDPERAHDYAINSMQLLGKVRPITRCMEAYNTTKVCKPIELFGLKFPNPVGLAAGFDKNAQAWTAAKALGLGFVEIGTVTHLRQPGNPRPRMWRIPEETAIINRLGFNNEGAKRVAKNLAAVNANKTRSIPLGINIGKSKAIPLDQAAEDYLASFSLLADYADYFTVNISSPNTPGLRKLQEKDFLPQLLEELGNASKDRAKKLGTAEIPMLLKVSPDLEFRQIDYILEALSHSSFAGIIATNTTISRPEGIPEDIPGGLSGKPLLPLSENVVRYIHQSTEGKLPIIGVGGITNVEAAGRIMDAGASLIQIYTGMIYNGPFFGRELARGLAMRQQSWLNGKS